MSSINRFLTRRHKHTGDASGHEKPKQTSGILRSLYSSPGDNKPATKEEIENVKIVKQKLARTGITSFTENDVEYMLRATDAHGNPQETFEMLVILAESQEGILREYNPNVKLLGAVNRKGVTCYLDALLFAMFARLGSFEAILYNSFDDEPRKRLAMLLRLWVNVLRSGRLINEDITMSLQDALVECGWKDAGTLRQQDASEAFTFITGKLALPLLTLKMDIFHTGKEDVTDDHKFVNERLLEVAIPDEPTDGTVVTLEDCLETYFNNRIEVRRYMERKGTRSSIRSKGSIDGDIDSNKGGAFHIETAEVEDSPPASPASTSRQTKVSAPSPLRPLQNRKRMPSIIQERYLDEKAKISGDQSAGGNGPSKPSRQYSSSIRKEIMMPAWQIFSLIPWYTANTGTSDSQVADHFATKRPVLGLCLKRYSMTPDGKAVRRGTYIDIPLEIGLPHFIKDDNMEEDGPVFGNFKLSLQSVVCHRGTSVDSGHYIALNRGQAPNAGPDATAGDHAPHECWMRFDDLAPDRVSYVDIKQALQDETPYLLYYQVQPIDEEPVYVAYEEKPPSYSESDSKDSGVGGLVGNNQSGHGSIQEAPEVGEVEEISDFGGSKFDGLSMEVARGRSSMTSDRRASISPTDASVDNGRLDPKGHTGSRRGSKVDIVGSWSRAGSQSRENRLGTTLSRLAGRNPKETAESTENTLEASKNAAAANGAEKSRLKKEKREKSKSRPHNHLTKGKNGMEKPDRECIAM
ncbi:Ubiquitin carboxyl-terminal hydrolase-like domain [Lasallia pustulata]|uniref:ubiquitinyl hydrolase 1 n=1 Tax=Lasallia pustulata TaxID=136370 RepID=A0A1W5DEI0_9LECA|nr:Ubiquitin carboxyl-terminal hydrolase-like domain [Lasallia pustulata]